MGAIQLVAESYPYTKKRTQMTLIQQIYTDYETTFGVSQLRIKN